MTNITEAKRVRDQLSASHERFTTVLEGLDAAVSVLSVQQGELLFANRCTGCGSGPMRAAMRCWPAATPACRCSAGSPPSVTTATRSTASAACRRRNSPRWVRTPERSCGAAAEVVRRAGALPAVDRRPPGADADRHRHHRAAATPRRKRRSRPRRRRSRQPADHHGRDGLLGGARAQPAADRHHQLLQRHGLARERRAIQKTT